MATACPVCGGEVEVRLGDVFARCRYCRASVIVDGEVLVGRYVVRAQLSPEAAAGALRRWMQGNEPVAGLAMLCNVEPTPQSVEWLPVWYARAAMTAAAEKGKAFTAHEARADATRVPEIKRRLIPPSALQRLRDERPDLPTATIALQTFRDGEELKGKEVKELALVHVPFYRMFYTYRGRRFSAAIDAATGEVRPGRFPAKPELPFRALTLVTLAIYLVANAVVATALWGDANVSHTIMMAYPATAAASAVLALLLLALV